MPLITVLTQQSSSFDLIGNSLIVFYLLLALIALCGCKFAAKGFYREEGFSRDVTDSVKGIFIWLVFLSHSSVYVNYTAKIDILGIRISWFLGQMIVTCFLFYSGYGICEAIKKKGTEYLRAFPKNRILKTLFHFDIAVMIYYFTQLMLGNKFSFTHVILSLIGWESLGNSNWYIFVILALYLITWIAFSCFKNSKVKSFVFATVIIGALMVFLYMTRPIWWYDTILCYILGMFVSLIKDRFVSVITKNNIVWSLLTASVIAVFLLLHSNIGKAEYVISSLSRLACGLLFAIGVVLLLMKIRISNKILIFSGRHLFEIFILHRIPMAVFTVLGFADYNRYLFIISSILCTILLSVGFRYITDELDKIIFNNKAPQR